MDAATLTAALCAAAGTAVFYIGLVKTVQRRSIERRFGHFVSVAEGSSTSSRPASAPATDLRRALRERAVRLGPALTRVFGRALSRRRLAAFEKQLPEAIDLIASSLAAGSTISQAIDAIVREMEAPIASEFRRMQREMELGQSVVEALQQMHERLPSNDLVLLASAVGIQHRVGGDLSPVLRNLSHTIRERQRLRGEINVLTAQARYSAMIVGALPVLLFAFLWVSNYAYLSNLFRPGVNLLLGVGIVMELIGFYVMRRMATVEA